jgi:hypothetical protein
VLGVQVIDGDSDVPVAVAEVVGLGPAVVDGQLDLEIGFAVSQVDEREPVEIIAVRRLQAERPGVEVARSFLIDHAEHRVDDLGHCSGPSLVSLRFLQAVE